MRATLLGLLCVLACPACDGAGGPDADADADIDPDAGDADRDAAPDARPDGEADAEADLFSFEVHVESCSGYLFEPGDAPVPAAAVAVDTPSGRTETQADDQGVARIAVEPDAEWVTVTVAKEGYLPLLTYYRMTVETIDAIIAANGDFVMCTTPIADIVQPRYMTITVSATGVPEGARWHASIDGAGGQRAMLPDEVLSFPWVEEGSEPVTLLGALVERVPDPDRPEAMTELVLQEIPDTLEDRSVVVEFDGVSETEPITVRDVTLLLPEDEQSLFRTLGLIHSEELFAWERETFLWCGFSLNYREAADRVTVDVAYLPLADEDLLWSFRLWPATTDGSSPWSQGWLSAAPEPGAEIQVIDVPRLSSPVGEPATLGSTFSWQPVEGSEEEVLWISSRTRSLWAVLSFGQSTVELPDLPSGYDESADWPAEGSAGFFGVSVVRNPILLIPVAERNPVEPLYSDSFQGFGASLPLTLER